MRKPSKSRPKLLKCPSQANTNQSGVLVVWLAVFSPYQGRDYFKRAGPKVMVLLWTRHMRILPLPVCVSCCAELCGLHGAQHGLQIQLLNSVGQFTFYPEDICSLSDQVRVVSFCFSQCCHGAGLVARMNLTWVPVLYRLLAHVPCDACGKLL